MPSCDFVLLYINSLSTPHFFYIPWADAGTHSSGRHVRSSSPLGLVTVTIVSIHTRVAVEACSAFTVSVDYGMRGRLCESA